ncbi:MAG: tRNA uridine-5-carboxymethylaminomethyl(34) synthesis enzyme MnmG, partial [Erysipelotrichaceae bacterium]|nr:tRNA uridine-5-carboxymethylaminomethyl(34) synthesis enzyme MnmG [Erysipelotrichaceae bacterium]
YGYQYGSVSKERYERYLSRQKEIDDLIAELPEMKIKSDGELSAYLTELGYDDNKGTYSLYDLVKRPKVSLAWLLKKLGVDKDKEVIDEVEISLKYEGYINKAKRGAERMIRLEKKRLPQNIDYMKVDNLRLEARQKLNQIKPATLGQAARISGINPSDLQVLAVYLKRGDLVNEL